MTRSFVLLAGLAALAGCPETDKTSGETGTPTGSCTPTPGPTLIANASVECDVDDNVTYYAETTGWVQQGGASTVYAIDSANNTPWSESHPIDTTLTARDACGTYDEISLTMPTRIYGGTTDIEVAYDAGISSGFTCSEHYTKPVMNYAFAIVDVDGNYADCFAFGHDPQGLVDGDYTSAPGTEPEMDLAKCTPDTAR